MTAFVIGALVGGNIVLWTEIVSRGPNRKLGVFEEHPMLGVAVVCAGAVVAMWVHGRLG